MAALGLADLAAIKHRSCEVNEPFKAIAFSSEVATGSCRENASKKTRTSLVIVSSP